jgi:hypothetical protein
MMLRCCLFFKQKIVSPTPIRLKNRRITQPDTIRYDALKPLIYKTLIVSPLPIRSEPRPYRRITPFRGDTHVDTGLFSRGQIVDNFVDNFEAKVMV